MHSWLAYRERDLDTAAIEAEGAVAAWESMPMPFEWQARWVLLAIALEDDRINEAIEEARVMITPPQHLQAAPVNRALETAVLLWDKGDTTAAQDKLARAMRLAEEFHYL